MDEINDAKDYDTRMTLLALLDYKTLFGEEGGLEDVIKAIQDIPSVTLLLHLSTINRSLYFPRDNTRTDRLKNRCLEASPYRWDNGTASGP